MTEEQIALAKRAVACKGFRWMPGMAFDATSNDATSTGWRIQSVGHGFFSCWASEVVVIKAGVCEFVISPRGNVHVRYAGRALPNKSSGCRMLPDLTDHATVGCLLALVRQALEDETATVSYDDFDGTFFCMARHELDGQPYWGVVTQADTEVEALVAALEAAP